MSLTKASVNGTSHSGTITQCTHKLSASITEPMYILLYMNCNQHSITESICRIWLLFIGKRINFTEELRTRCDTDCPLALGWQERASGTKRNLNAYWNKTNPIGSAGRQKSIQSLHGAIAFSLNGRGLVCSRMVMRSRQSKLKRYDGLSNMNSWSTYRTRMKSGAAATIAVANIHWDHVHTYVSLSTEPPSTTYFWEKTTANMYV